MIGSTDRSSKNLAIASAKKPNMIAPLRKHKVECPPLLSDKTVLERMWRGSVQLGKTLPEYEDVVLGSLGRLGDHLILLEAARRRNSRCCARGGKSAVGSATIYTTSGSRICRATALRRSAKCCSRRSPSARRCRIACIVLPKAWSRPKKCSPIARSRDLWCKRPPYLRNAVVNQGAAHLFGVDEAKLHANARAWLPRKS
jgi:hypothetical protein